MYFHSTPPRIRFSAFVTITQHSVTFTSPPHLTRIIFFFFLFFQPLLAITIHEQHYNAAGSENLFNEFIPPFRVDRATLYKMRTNFSVQRRCELQVSKLFQHQLFYNSRYSIEYESTRLLDIAIELQPLVIARN